MSAYRNALREEGTRDDLMKALEREWAKNDEWGEPSALIPIRLLKSLLRGGFFPGKHADDVRELIGMKRKWDKK